MKNINKSLLKSILTTTTLTIAISGGALGVNVTPTKTPAVITDPTAWAPSAPVNGDVILLTALFKNVNVDKTITLGGIDMKSNTGGVTRVIAPNALVQTTPVVLTLGYVKDTTSVIPLQHTIVLDPGALAQSGIVLQTPDDATTGSQYTSLSAVTFSAPNSYLTFNATGTLTYGGQLNTSATANFNVNNTVISTGFVDNSVLGKGTGAAGGTLNIGSAANAANLISRPGGNVVVVSNKVAFLNPASVLTFDATNAGGNATFVLDGANIGGNASGSGILQLNAKNNSITVGSNALETIGTKANPLQAVLVTGDKSASISSDTYANNTLIQAGNTLTLSTSNYYSPVNTVANGTGQLTLLKTVTGLGQIGAAGASLGVLTINTDNTFANAVNAKTINVASNKTATFNSSVASSSLVLNTAAAGDTAQATFTGDVQVNFPITTLVNKTGTVTFKGSTVVSSEMGTNTNKLFNVIFDNTAGKVQSLKANINSNEVSFTNSTVSVDAQDVTINAPADFDNANVYLNSNRLHLTGATDIENNLNVVTSFNGSGIGQIVLEGVSLIDTTLTKQINISLVDNSGGYLPSGTSVASFPMVTGDLSTSKLDPNKVFGTAPTNSFVIWNFDKNTFTFTATNNALNAADALLRSQNATGETLDAAKKIFNPNNALDAFKFASNIQGLAGVNPSAFKQAIDKFRSVQDNASVVRHVVDEAVAVVAQRAETLSAGSIRGINVDDRATVAAGDEQKYSRYGAWGSPFYSHAVQKRRKQSIDGYKANSGGATLGYDTMANDTMTVGVAATYVKTDAKYKNNLAGDKSKVNSYLFTIYGTQLLCDDYFVTGIATFGSSKVKYRSPRYVFLNGATATQTAKASYDAMNWGGELTGGYHYKYKAKEDILLVPSVGVAYNEFGSAGYTETNTTSQNRTVNQKNTRKLEALAGLRAVSGFENSGILYTPEVHAFVKQAITNKSPRTQITLNGMVDALYPKIAKNTRTSGNLGASLTVQSGSMDYSVSYDFNVAKKYTAHTGALKVRANF